MIKRLLISFIAGTIFVIILLSIGLQYFYRDKGEPEKTYDAVKIERLSEYETKELFERLGMEFDPKPVVPNLIIPEYEPSNAEVQEDGSAILQHEEEFQSSDENKITGSINPE